MEKLFQEILKKHKELTRSELARLDYAKTILEFQLEAISYNHDRQVEKIFDNAISQVKSYL